MCANRFPFSEGTGDSSYEASARVSEPYFHAAYARSVKRPSGSGLLAALSAIIVLLWVALKSTVITVVELARAVLRLLADPVGEWARGWKWLAIKLGLSVWVRELFTLAVARDVYAGVPSRGENLNV